MDWSQQEEDQWLLDWSQFPTHEQPVAATIVQDVMNDLIGRGGIKWELESIGPDVVKEILTKLVGIVEKALDKEGE